MHQMRASNGLTEVIDDVFRMPKTMRDLAMVQFFSWFALFALWIFTTAAVTAVHFGTSDTTSTAYNEGANWVGILFGVYNGVAALAAFAIPVIAQRTGRKVAHAINLALGGLGLIGVFLIRDPQLLWLPMIGIGIAWASILSMPYAILSAAVPDRKMGVYMGVFNIFIVVPQLLAATVLGLILKTLFDGQAIWALVLGAVSFVLAAAMKKHNTPALFCVQNSWSHYNQTSHSIVPGTTVGIPPGSFMARWEDIKNRSFYVYADVVGFKSEKLPDWSFRDLV
jgi:maltose/moltooligosaccharide transporter